MYSIASYVAIEVEILFCLLLVYMLHWSYIFNKFCFFLILVIFNQIEICDIISFYSIFMLHLFIYLVGSLGTRSIFFYEK